MRRSLGKAGSSRINSEGKGLGVAMNLFSRRSKEKPKCSQGSVGAREHGCRGGAKARWSGSQLTQGLQERDTVVRGS